LLVRSPRAVAGGVLLPVVLLVVRGNGREVAGLAVLGVLSTAFITHAGSLVTARQAGVLRRWRATPLLSWCWFAGRIGATVAVAVSGGVFTVFAGVALYGVGVDAALVPVLVLGALTWASLGIAASALIPTAEAAWPLLGAVYLPLVLLSGALGGGEPDWISTVMRWLPAEPIVAGASRGAFTAREMAVLVVWGTLGLAVALRWFRWQPRTA
jgi:ABC-2 type transport system permease protein